MMLNKLINIKQYYKNYKLKKKIKKLSKEEIFWNTNYYFDNIDFIKRVSKDKLSNSIDYFYLTFDNYYNNEVRQNIINDNTFKKSLYIKTLEKELGIKNFKKEYKEQYDIMLDTFRTLFLINNAFYSDTNGSLENRIELATNILAKYLYKDDSETTKKYGSKKINNLFDEYCISLNKKFFKWYEVLQTPANYLKNHPKELNIIKEEISNEIKMLNFVNYDYSIEDNIILSKDNDNKYSKYLSKFNYLYPQREQFIEEYKKDFYITYNQELSNTDIDNIAFIYDLIEKLNNGIVDLITLKRKNNYKEIDVLQNYIYYFYIIKVLNIFPIIDTPQYNKGLKLFFDNLNNLIGYFRENNIIGITSNCCDDIFLEYKNYFNTIVNNYDFLLFKFNIDMFLKTDIKNNRMYKIMNEYILELKEIYIKTDLIFHYKDIDIKSLNVLENSLKRCNKIIEKEKNVFIRIR